MKGRLFNLCYDVKGKKVYSQKRFDPPEKAKGDGPLINFDMNDAKQAIEAAIQQEIITWLPERHARAGLQVSLAGLHAQ